MSEEVESKDDEERTDEFLYKCANQDVSEKDITLVVEKVNLKKSISLLGATSILIANVGGASVFIAPTTILKYAGSPGMALVMWICGGIVQVLLAFSVSEIALLFKKAGGPYFFVYKAFGDVAGFVFMWGFMFFIGGPCWALSSYTSSLYFLSLFFTDCQPPDHIVKLIGIFILVTFIALNCTYMKVITKIQGVLTLSKILALLIIIVVGFIFIPTESGQENIELFMEGTSLDAGSIALALFSGFFAFGGWQIITILVEEVKEPEKNVPRSLAFSFSVLIVANALANFAYYTVLHKKVALSSDAVAILFGKQVNKELSFVLATLVVLCSLSSLNALMLGQSRLVYAAGRNKHLPKIMTMLHKKFNTPWPAMFLLGTLGAFMLLSGSVTSLLNTIGLYSAFMTFLLMLIFCIMRWKEPHLPRPIKVPIVIPCFCLMLTTTLMILSVIAKPRELGFVVLIVLCGVPVYFICVKWQKPTKLFRCMDPIGHYLQLALNLQYTNV